MQINLTNDNDTIKKGIAKMQYLFLFFNYSLIKVSLALSSTS